MATGGLGGLGGLELGPLVQSLGLSLLSSPREAPFANLPTVLASRQKQQTEDAKTGALYTALVQAGLPEDVARSAAADPTAASLLISTANQKTRLGVVDRLGAEGQGLTAPPTGAAPAAPAGGLGGLGGAPQPQGPRVRPGFGTPRADISEGLTGAARALAPPLVQTESGGKYDILGPDTGNGNRAVGRYQIMMSNIPSWTEEALGKRMTWQEFRNDPKAQDTVYNYKINQYYANSPQTTEFGKLRDAASMWHSGRPYARAVAAGANDGNISTRDYASGIVAQAARGLPQGAAPGQGGLLPQDAAALPATRVSGPVFPAGPIPGAPADVAPLPPGLGMTDAERTTPQGRAAALGIAPPANASATLSAIPANAPAIAGVAPQEPLPAPVRVAAGGGKISLPTQIPAAVATPISQTKLDPNGQTAKARARQQQAWALKVIGASGALGDEGKGLTEQAKLIYQDAAKYLSPTDKQRALLDAGIDPDSQTGRSLLLLEQTRPERQFQETVAQNQRQAEQQAETARLSRERFAESQLTPEQKAIRARGGGMTVEEYERQKTADEIAKAENEVRARARGTDAAAASSGAHAVERVAPALSQALSWYDAAAAGKGVGPQAANSLSRAIVNSPLTPAWSQAYKNEVARQGFESAIAAIQNEITAVRAKGQGAVSNYERTLLGADLPKLDSPPEIAYQAFERLKRQLNTALERDRKLGIYRPDVTPQTERGGAANTGIETPHGVVRRIN